MPHKKSDGDFIDLDIALEDLSPRLRILRASLQLFVEQGYFNTNVPDISKASKCSVGSIYHHFLNKEEIAKCIRDEGVRQFRQVMVESLETDKIDLKETILAIVVSMLAFAEAHRLLAQYLWLTRHGEFLKENIRRPTVIGFDALGRLITKHVKTAIRKKEIPRVKAEIFWSIVFGIPLSYIRDWLEGYSKELPTAVAIQISNACWGALQSAEDHN